MIVLSYLVFNEIFDDVRRSDKRMIKDSLGLLRSSYMDAKHRQNIPISQRTKNYRKHPLTRLGRKLAIGTGKFLSL